MGLCLRGTPEVPRLRSGRQELRSGRRIGEAASRPLRPFGAPPLWTGRISLPLATLGVAVRYLVRTSSALETLRWDSWVLHAPDSNCVKVEVSAR